MIGGSALTAGVPVSAASPSDVSAGSEAFENGPSGLMKRLMSGASARRSWKHRGRPGRRSPQSFWAVGVSWRRKLGEALEVGGQVGAALGGRLGGLARAVDEVGELLAVARQRREHRVGVRGQVGEDLVLGGQDVEDLVGLLAGAGLARRMASLRSLPRPAKATPSSLRMIEKRSR